ncbi:MAG TPA: hypothetical protein VFR36_08415 [Sphingomicrobium sp.]|nr:hypothetical protein [Sphingomicrobium sp.]
MASTACAIRPPAATGPTAALGQIAIANGLKVRPFQLIEDSRCPINAACVWAGRLIVRTEVIGGSWRQTRDLELGKSQQIADGTLVLISAQPSRQAGIEIDPHSYRFTFDFQGVI